MYPNPRTLCASLCASLALTATAVLTGCSGLAPTPPANAIPVTGNWQFSSTAIAAVHLPSLSGSLNGTSSAMTGTLHADSATACSTPTTAIPVTGSTTAEGTTTLTGPLAGGTLSVTGALAPDGKSLSDATYTVSGGSCAFPAAAPALAQSYSSITGNYTGSFSDSDGQVIALNATLTQTPASDTDGNFQLSGTGTFPSNPCFNSPVSVSNSQVTGGSFNLTYADPTTLNSVNVSGTFSTDGTTLTVTNWTLTGSCGPDTGTGLLTRE
jgi:hypothetical protein